MPIKFTEKGLEIAEKLAEVHKKEYDSIYKIVKEEIEKESIDGNG